MIYEILIDGKVENTIVADEQFMLEHYPEGNYRQVPDTPEQAPAPAWEWWVDIGPFFDRFGAGFGGGSGRRRGFCAAGGYGDGRRYGRRHGAGL